MSRATATAKCLALSTTRTVSELRLATVQFSGSSPPPPLPIPLESWEQLQQLPWPPLVIPLPPQLCAPTDSFSFPTSAWTASQRFLFLLAWGLSNLNSAVLYSEWRVRRPLQP